MIFNSNDYLNRLNLVTRNDALFAFKGRKLVQDLKDWEGKAGEEVVLFMDTTLAPKHLACLQSRRPWFTSIEQAGGARRPATPDGRGGRQEVMDESRVGLHTTSLAALRSMEEEGELCHATVWSWQAAGRHQVSLAKWRQTSLDGRPSGTPEWTKSL